MSNDASVIDANHSPEPVEYDDWREHLESGTLLGVECQRCGHVTATPKRVCLDCGDRRLAAVKLPEHGEVYSETTITVPPTDVDGPYQVAVIDLGPTRLLARVNGDVDIGDRAAFSGTIELGGSPAPVFELLD